MSFLNFWKSFFLPIRLYTGGGSGGGGPTNTTVQNSNIPEYARPYVETMLGTAQQQIYNYGPGTPGRAATYDAEGNELTPYQPASTGAVTGFKPYVPYGATVDASGNITNTAQEQAGAAVAPFSPLQQQSFLNAGTIGMPGQFNIGTGFQAMGGMGAANVADRAANVGNQYNMMATNPYAQQAFMSPYIQNALTPQLEEMQRQYGITGTQEQGKATAAGAFGGSRQALMQAENQRNKNMAMNQAIGTGYQNAFQSAQQAQQYGANLGLQGYGTALQGTGQLTQAGSALGQMGGQQLAAQQGIVGLQNQMGQQQQTQQQNMVNQAIQNYAMQQQYPMQQLSAMSGLLRGLPLQSATTQSYQAAPSTISQLSGLGLTAAAGYGMMRKEGGVIKSYAGGGAVEDETENFVSGGISKAISRKVLLNPDAYSAQTIDRGTKNGLIDDIVGLAALQEKNKETKERQGQAAMGQGTPPTVKDQIVAEAEQLQGIDNAQSNLPTEYAGGGIVAFNEGGSAFSEDIKALQDMYKEKVGAGTRGVKEGTRGVKEGMDSFINYFTKPRQAITDADAQPGGLYGNNSNVPPEAAPTEAKKDTGIRILDNAPATKPGAAPSATPTGNTTGMGESGIDDLIRQSIGDIRTSKEASKDARKEAKLMAMLQAGLGIMGGTSPYAAANFKGAIPALQGYQEEMRGIRSDENKQIAQIAALNLKGAELKAELKKLGITKEHYDSQNKKNIAYANYLESGKGRGGSALYGGAIPPATSQKVNAEYKGYAANPASAPFFSSLPKDVQVGLTKYKPGTESYNRSLQAFNQFSRNEMAKELSMYSQLNRRSGAPTVADDLP